MLKSGSKTVFGRNISLEGIKTYEEFKAAVPIRDYEQFKAYIDQIKQGKHNVLWKGQPIYLQKPPEPPVGLNIFPF